MDAMIENMRSSLGNGVRKMFSNNNQSGKNNNLATSDARDVKMNLTEICAKEGATIPFIVRDICNFISKRSIRLEGIFRVNASARLLNELRELFESNTNYVQDLLLNRPETTDMVGHAAAALLKEFMRQLSTPLINDDILRIYLDSKSLSDKDFCEKVKLCMNDWPAAHRDTLLHLLPFLHNVAQESKNRMSVNSLAVVFGPNVFRLPDGPQVIRAQTLANNAFERLLSCSYLLAPTRPSPLLRRSLARQTPVQSDQSAKPVPAVRRSKVAQLKEGSVKSKEASPRSKSDSSWEEETVTRSENTGDLRYADDKRSILEDSIRSIVRTRLFNSAESSSISDDSSIVKPENQLLNLVKLEDSDNEAHSVVTITATEDLSTFQSRNATNIVTTPDSGCVADEFNSLKVKSQSADIQPVFVPKLNLRSSFDEESLKASDVPQLDLSTVTESVEREATKPQNSDSKSAEKNRKKKSPQIQKTNKVDSSLENVRDQIVQALRDHRRVAGRPYDISKMLVEELKEEKLSMQRELLKYERSHGRPSTREEKQTMRDVYDRYRAVKRLLSAKITDENSNTLKAELEDSFLLTRPFELTSCDESDVTHDGTPTSDLETQLRDLHARRKRLRRILRDFESRRAEDNLARRIMRSEYDQYRVIKSKIRELEIALTKNGVEIF